MDTSAASAFSNVDVEEDGKVTVSEDKGQSSMHDVDFPDVFHETSNKKPTPPRPRTPKIDNRSPAKKVDSAIVVDEVEPGAKDMPAEADDPAAEMGATETPKGSQGKTISVDDTKYNEDIHESSAPHPAEGHRTIITSLREGVRPGTSNRRDFALVPSKVALLVIDIQEYLSAPSSVEDEATNAYFYQASLPRTISNVAALLKQIRPQRDELEQGCEVIFTYLEALTSDCRDVSLDYKLSGPQLAHLPNLATCPATFLPDVLPQPRDGKGDLLIPKTSCSVFMSTNLHYVLQNLYIEQLLVCGQLTDQCVESAVRDAADLGYFVTVVQDACAAHSEASHQKGLSGMKGFSRIMSTEDILGELRNPQAEGVLRSVPTVAAVVEKQETTASAVAISTDETIRPDVAIVSVMDYTPSASPYPDTTLAMLRALQFAGVVFLRFMAVDAYNSIRCKAVPLDHLIQQGGGNLDYQVAIAQVCFAGLPSYGDTVLEETGLDAKKVLTLRPDPGTLRILPYGTKTAVVFGTAHEIGDKSLLSPLCTRGLLLRVMQSARDYGIGFVSFARL
jgi:ureidoacrylate peracid hydrolase